MAPARGSSHRSSRRSHSWGPRVEWQGDFEHGSLTTGALNSHTAPVILDDLLHNGQSQACAIAFPVTHKGGKELVTNGLGNSRTIIGDSDFQALVVRAARFFPNQAKPPHKH